MNKKVIVPIIALILIAILPSSVLVSAKSTKSTETGHVQAKVAEALWDDGSYVLVFEQKSHDPGFKEKVVWIEVDLKVDGGISESKEIDPSEFKWSFSSCRVSTEVASLNLVVEWEPVPPTMNYHENEKFEWDSYDLHGVYNRAYREASATLDLNEGEFTLGEESVSSATIEHFTWVETEKMTND